MNRNPSFEWQAREDAETLVRAEEIKKDSERMMKAKEVLADTIQSTKNAIKSSSVGSGRNNNRATIKKL